MKMLLIDYFRRGRGGQREGGGRNNDGGCNMGLYIAHIDLAVYNATESKAAGKSNINDIGQYALPQYTHRWICL